MEDVEKLLEHVNALKGLLDDPRPGVFTWNSMVGKRIEEISKFGGPMGE